MTYLSSWKMPKDSNSAVHCYFHSCSYKKNITHLTICEFSPLPSSSSSSSSAATSKTSTPTSEYAREKYLRNGEFHRARSSISESTTAVSVVLKKQCSKNRKKPALWKELVFGSKKLRGIILLNLISIVYASDIAVIKDVEAFTDPAYFSAVRFGVSAIPFLPFVFQARNDSEVRNSGLELGLWVSLGYLSEAFGLVTSDAGRASFISLFTVIVVPVIESMLGEIVPARTWFGVLMSVLGISMLECSGSPPNIGDLFNFLSAIFFGIHTLRTEHISRTTRKEHLLPLLGYEVCVVAILSTIWCMMGGNNDGTISWSWGWFWDQMVVFPWIPALYTGVFSTGLCLWGEIAAMRDVSAMETAVIYGLEPVWGAGFAWFLLGERWGVAGWIGALLILGGSLSVPILGGSETESRDKNEALIASDKKTLSASPLMVKSSSRDKVF